MDAKQSYYRNHREELRPFLPAHVERVLEIGCGEGMFRAHLPAECQYDGVEMSVRAAAVAATRLDRVHVGTFEQTYDQLPDRHFDLIVCNDVIEHMPDHDTFLDRIKAKMTTGACMVGSIPNVRYYPHLKHVLLNKDWRYADDGILDRTHLRFFTEKSWRRTLTDHGYDIQLLRGINAFNLGDSVVRKFVNQRVVGLLGADTRFRQFGFQARLS